MLFSKKNKNHNLLIERESTEPADWLNYEEPETEGQLAIDVYQTDNKIIVQSTIAGVEPEDLKISLHHDLLTIKGNRSARKEIKEENYLYRECYWGSFSRSIILPAEVDSKSVEAEIKNGVLTVTLKKISAEQINIKVKD
ncbi:MAG: Hsp20/alpha crystallin family protein [Patescibacteria group bacterium]|jgi:HSP20 family protein